MEIQPNSAARRSESSQVEGYPPLSECIVMEIGGEVTSIESIHAAINEAMLPLSREFVSALIDAVRSQTLLDREIIDREEKLVRGALKAAGEEHGTSGFSNRRIWLKQEMAFLSCVSGGDPTGNGSASVPYLTYEVYDNRAYRDAKLIISPNYRASAFGSESIVGAAPSYRFEIAPSGRTIWSNAQPILAAISPHNAIEDWTHFGHVEPVASESPHKGAYHVTTQDGIEMTLKCLK